MVKLNQTTHALRFLRGLTASLTTANNDVGYSGEPFYSTDDKELYINDGTSYVPYAYSKSQLD